MRKALITLFLLLSISTAYARTITGTGYGDTPEEALENARRDLISQFSISVSSLIYTSTNDYGDGSDTYSLSTGSVQYSSIEIKGEEKTVRKEGDSFKATSILDENDAEAYYLEVQELRKSIPNIRTMIDSGKSDEEKLELYRTLIASMKKYETDREVIAQLAPGRYELSPLDFNRVEIEAEYSNLLSKENNSLDLTIKELERQSSLQIITAEGEARLKEARKELEENIRYQDELQKANENDYNLRLQTIEQSIKTSAEAFSASFGISSTAIPAEESFSSLMNIIEADRASFKALKDSVNTTLHDIESSYDSESKATMQSVLNRPYAKTQLDEKGRPKEGMEEARIQQAEKLTESRRKFYETASDTAYSTVKGQFEIIKENALPIIDELNTKTFTVTNRGSGITTVIKAADFDTENYVFYGSAYVPVADTTLAFTFRIPLFDWVVDDFWQDVEGEAIYSIADEWIEIFEDYPSSFTIEAKLKIKANASNNKYTATITEYAIKRPGETDSIYRETINRTYTFSYGTNADLLDISVYDNGMISDNDAKEGMQSFSELIGKKYPIAITADSLFGIPGEHLKTNISLGASAELFIPSSLDILNFSVSLGMFWDYSKIKDIAGSYELTRETHMLGIRLLPYINAVFPAGLRGMGIIGLGFGVDTRFNGGTHLMGDIRADIAFRGEKQGPAFIGGVDISLTSPDLTGMTYGISDLFFSLGISLGMLF